MSIPSTLTAARQAVAGAKAPLDDKAFAANHAYAQEHDHWQDGDEWIGPRGSDALWPTIKKAVERSFTPVDAIGEVLERLANALLRREPDVAFVPLEPIEKGKSGFDQQQAEVTEIQDQITAWWDQSGLWGKAREAVKRSRWAGYGTLRLWIPPGRLEEVEGGKRVIPSGLDFEGALDLLKLTAPSPDTCAVLKDADTQEPYAVFLYEKNKVERAEVWYVDSKSGETVLLDVGDGGADGEDASEHRYQLGGRLPIVEIRGEILITDPVRRQQRRLNFFESLITRVAETAGFPERYTTNAQPNGIWSQTAPTDGPPRQTQSFGGKTYYLHPAPRTLGAAVTTELLGVPVERKLAGGGTEHGFESPGVEFKEPTDPQYAIGAAKHAKHTILNQCKQGHIALEARGEASGIAYEQARGDFAADVDQIRGPAEGCLRGILECVTAFADDLAGTPLRTMEKYRARVDVRVSLGPISPEEKEQNASQVEKGLLSRPSAMAANGVEDVQAELQRVEAEPEAQITITTKRTGIISALLGAAPDMSIVQAAIVAGYDEEEARRLFGEADAAAVQGRQAREEIQAALLEEQEEQRDAA